MKKGYLNIFVIVLLGFTLIGCNKSDEEVIDVVIPEDTNIETNVENNDDLNAGTGTGVVLDEKYIITNKIASSLIEEKFGKCSIEECGTTYINILVQKDTSQNIEVIYDGLKDDSIKATNTVYGVSFEDEKWVLGEELEKTFKCQKDRGQQDFGSKSCK